ncbi:MAG: transaldolase [Burkholderiaceae bacterium]|nr:transaldolase [Burkholderiaceae bacterium]
MNALEGLSRYTTVVADTGDVGLIARYQPQDATTNPSLILKAVGLDSYKEWLLEMKAPSSAQGSTLEGRVDALLVRFGQAILKVIPGRVSTEIDARLSFDVEASFARAVGIAERYNRLGIHNDRFLIKIASTWEGIEAARRLEREGIHCNLTLLFSMAQAAVCADAGVRLISPFVGRIYDWYQKNSDRLPNQNSDQLPNQNSDQLPNQASADLDPGVASVRRIYRYFRRHGYHTEVMGASFRNTSQILALAGCDLLTISPDLLGALQQMPADALNLDWRKPQQDDPSEKLCLSESQFRWAFNEDQMASDKLAEGIRSFAADSRKLDALLS